MQIDPTKIVALARIAHAANREFCLVTGDSQASPVWDETGEEMKASAIAGVRCFLDDPNMTPEQLHEEWMNGKLRDGWVHGEVKDADVKTHPCLVPYDQLSAADRFKDTLFMSILMAYLDFIYQEHSSDLNKTELDSSEFEVMQQLFNKGPIEDGDLVSKTSRDSLIERGLVFARNGFQSLTPDGLDKAIALGMDERKYASLSK